MPEKEPPPVPQKKSFDDPDSVDDSALGLTKIVRIGAITFRRRVINPGCRITESYEDRHIHLQFTGRTRVRMHNGAEEEYGPGEVGDIPPGYESWVVGNKRATIVEITGLRQYIKPEPAEEKETDEKTAEKERAAVKETGQDLMDALNARNAGRVASHFTDNADFVTARGKVIHRRENIEKYFETYLHTLLPADSLFRVYERRIRIVTSYISHLDLRWDLVQANRPSQHIPHSAGLMTLNFIKDQKRWGIYEMHSIDITKDEERRREGEYEEIEIIEES